MNTIIKISHNIYDKLVVYNVLQIITEKLKKLLKKKQIIILLIIDEEILKLKRYCDNLTT